MIKVQVYANWDALGGVKFLATSGELGLEWLAYQGEYFTL